MNKVPSLTAFFYFLFIVVFLFAAGVGNLHAVETAPRISDREIIESLAVLKKGQEDINQRIDDMNQRFNDMNQRFEDMREDMNQRFEDMREDMNQRFGDMNQRFGDMNQRLEGLQNTMLVLFGAIITLIVALFGYIAWDRRTALRPMREKLESLEAVLRQDLEIQHEGGSRITRLINALRVLAKTDKQVAEVLKAFSLM